MEDIIIETILWIVGSFAGLMILAFWFDPHTFSIFEMLWNHYIVKSSPEYMRSRFLKMNGRNIHEKGGWLDVLRDRVAYLEENKKRKIERMILNDIIYHTGEYKQKLTGKYKNKVRMKGISRSDGRERRFSTFK